MGKKAKEPIKKVNMFDIERAFDLMMFSYQRKSAWKEGDEYVCRVVSPLDFVYLYKAFMEALLACKYVDIKAPKERKHG